MANGSDFNCFVSYRRDDTKAVARLIYEDLATRLGSNRVFFDIDTIPLGEDFVAYLGELIEQSHVVLAVIGDRWTGGSKILQADDFVRIEIESAINRGIPVLPVFADGARAPRLEDVPPTLHSVLRRNGVSVDSGRGFRRDMQEVLALAERLAVRFQERQRAAAETNAGLGGSEANTLQRGRLKAAEEDTSSQTDGEVPEVTNRGPIAPSVWAAFHGESRGLRLGAIYELAGLLPTDATGEVRTLLVEAMNDPFPEISSYARSVLGPEAGNESVENGSLGSEAPADRVVRPQVADASPSLETPSKAPEQHSISAERSHPETEMPVEYSPSNSDGKHGFGVSLPAKPSRRVKVIAATVIGIALLGSMAALRKPAADNPTTSAPEESASVLSQTPSNSAEANLGAASPSSAIVSVSTSDRAPETPAPPSAAVSTTAPARRKPPSTTAPATGDVSIGAGTAVAPAPGTTMATAPAGFNIGAARQALIVAAAQTSICKRPDGPAGAGKVQVTFAPSGRVTTVNLVSGVFGDTPVGGCVSGVFSRALVPAFSGAPVTVSKSFEISP